MINREVITRFLCAFSAVTAAVSCTASAIYPKSGLDCVSAADVSYRLTAEQTLALYGRQLSGTWYNANDGLTRNINFTYAFTMEQWRPNDYSSSPTYIKSCNYGSSGDSNTLRDNLRSSQFLIYTSEILYENNNYPWVSSNTADHANVNLDFSVDFADVTVWSQYIMWSGTQTGGQYRPGHSYCLNTFADDSFYKINALASGQYYAYALFPWYPAITQSNITESKLMRANIIYEFFGLDGETYNLSRQNLVLNDYHDIAVDGTSLLPNSHYVLMLFIGCPTVSGYQVHPTTTAPPSTGIGTQASYQTFPTVDLSNIESGISGMIQKQEENNYYQRIQIDQLNTVIEQLNAIYARMVANGEVPVSLTPADPYAVFNSDVLHDIDGITTHTMAQLPPVGNGAQAVGSLIDEVFSFDSIFMAIGAFSLGFAVFCWFVFRGRG